MAQEIVTWCDVHMNRDERVPAQTVTVALNSMAPRQLDLCETCRKEILGALEAILEDARPVRGVRESVPSAAEATVGPKESFERSCPLCEAEGSEYIVRTRGAMRDHMKSIHKRSLNEVESERGYSVEGTPLKYKCNVEGCGLKFPSGHSLGAHRRRDHPSTGAEQEALSV